MVSEPFHVCYGIRIMCIQWTSSHVMKWNHGAATQINTLIHTLTHTLHLLCAPSFSACLSLLSRELQSVLFMHILRELLLS